MIEKQIIEAQKFLTQKTQLRPRLGFVLGSGLSGFAKKLVVDISIPYAEIPHFAVSSVEGHPGRLIIGTLEETPVIVMQGRLHAYEGLTAQQVVFPVRTMAAFGVKTLVVTNASGGLKRGQRAGDFMILRDHLNLTGNNPLIGPNINPGPRFLDMTEVYDPTLRQILKSALRAEKVRATEGVYVGVLGPTYETASEVQFYAKIGGGCVGMSTVSEVIAARHAGLKVVGLSCITNLGTGLSKVKLSHDDVKKVAEQAESQFTRALTNFTRRIKKLK